jgi:hypothetical protein
VSEIKREDILTELTCFEKTLKDKVDEVLEENLEPVVELNVRTRKLELDMAAHVAGDETENILEQIKDIKLQINDPNTGVQTVQRELCNTLKSFKEEVKIQLEFNQKAHETLADNQKEMRKEFKDDSKHYDEKLDAFQEKTTARFEDIKKDIHQLRIGGIVAVCMLAVLMLAVNPEAAEKMMKAIPGSIFDVIQAAISYFIP